MDNAKKATLGMSLIVKTVADWLQGLILLFGVYVFISGSTLPGGAFPSGVIIALSFVLIILSHSRGVGLRRLKERQTTILTCIGVSIFLLAALSGLFIGNSFFKNLTSPDRCPPPSMFSGSLMFIYEIGIALLVSMALLLVFSMLARSADSGHQ